MKKKKNAFTLIELLAIIVILAIIAVITVPIILNIIENSRKGAATDSAYGFKDAVNKYYLSEMINDKNFRIDGTYTINENGEMVKGSEILSIPVSGQKPTGGEITYELQNIKEGCLTINDYKVIFNGNKVESVNKGICYEQTTITFDLNYNNQKDEQQKNIDKKIGTLPNPTRTNYALEGWFTDASGGTQINADTMVTGQKTYYAHWVQNAVSVTFDSRGGSAVTQTTVQMNHSYNQDHTQLPETTRDGYTFLGWFETQEGGSAITGTETLTTDKTYYAQWEEQAQTYTVTFVDYDNNSIVYSSQNVNEGEHATEPTKPQKENYAFVGWYSSGGSLWSSLDFDNYEITNDETLYAKFISLSSIECPGPNCVYVYHEEASAMPNSPASSNYSSNLETVLEAAQPNCGNYTYSCGYESDYNNLIYLGEQANMFIAYTLNGSGNITSSYVCLMYDENNSSHVVCLKNTGDGYDDFAISKLNEQILINNGFIYDDEGGDFRKGEVLSAKVWYDTGNDTTYAEVYNNSDRCLFNYSGIGSVECTYY